MSLETLISACMNEIPKVVASGVVDLSTGMLVAVKTIDSHPPEILELLAPATKDMFEGENVTAIEETFKKIRGIQSEERYFQEILISSTNLLHFFGRLNSSKKHIVTIVCRSDVNLGMLLAKGRAICERETLE